MDLADFKAKLAKAREIEVESSGAKFRLHLPSEHAWRCAYEENTVKGRVHRERMSRQLVEQALLGWEGVTEKHFLGEGAGDPVAFSVEARILLLDERQDIADELSAALMKRLNERRAQIEDSRKNS